MHTTMWVPFRRVVLLIVLSMAGFTKGGAQSASPKDSVTAQATAVRRCVIRRTSCERSFAILIDQDLLQQRWISPSTDRNYTMGFGFARSGPEVWEGGHDVLLKAVESSLDWFTNILPWLVRSDARSQFFRSLNDTTTTNAFAEVFHGTAFTPDSIEASSVVVGDRPYAFLLGWTVSRVILNELETRAFTSEFTIGHIGSRLGRNVQRFIHKFITGSADPKGWSNQVLDTPGLYLGTLTARYGISVEQQLKAWHWPGSGPADPEPPKRLELTGGIGAQAGYYTEAEIGARLRIGHFTSPFWTQRMNPLAVGSRAPGTRGRRLDAFAFAGGRQRLVGYNALLQGYGPSADEYRISSDDVSRTVGEWEIGASVIWRFGPEQNRAVQFAYVVDAGRTREFRSPLERSHHWGGVYLVITSP
jgi:hypothetical protein